MFLFNVVSKGFSIAWVNFFGGVKGINQFLDCFLNSFQDVSLLQVSLREELILFVVFHFVVLIRLKLGIEKHFLV